MEPPTDLVSDVLRSMEVSGSLLIRDSYRPPWGIDLPDTGSLTRLLGLPAGTHVVAFHLVRHGRLDITLADGTTQAVEEGEVAIVFGGGWHRMSQDAPAEPMPLHRFLAGERPDAPPDAASGAPTGVICGAFVLRHTRLNPLFESLPPVATLSVRDGEGWLASVASQIVTELEAAGPGGAFVVARLLELLCAAAVRSFLASSPTEPGWLHAFGDPAVAAALGAIHADPAHPWTVARLADRASMSRSRFADRFLTALGESPMRYVAKWRMNVAMRLLAGENRPLQQVASRVGYENVAAFSRAFKQHVGTAPSRYRDAAGRGAHGS